LSNISWQRCCWRCRTFSSTAVGSKDIPWTPKHRYELIAIVLFCCTVFTLQSFENICLNCFSFPAHCSSCQFDLCDNCIKPYRSTYHPAHVLYKADYNLVYPGSNGGWGCDRCSREFIPPLNNVPFHCSQCEFDLCDSCMKTTGDVSNAGNISNYGYCMQFVG
jgi:hypothetical protein